MPFFRCLLVCVTLLVLSVGARAQSPLQYGALGGASLASQSPGQDGRTGFNLAVFVDYPFLPYASVSLEAAFVQKGQTFDGELSDVDTTFTGTSTIGLDVLVQEKLIFDGPEGAVRVSIDEHESTVWGYDVGLGIQVGRLLPAPVLAEIRFSGDLTNAFDGTTRATTRNQVVQLRIGVEF